MLPPLPRRSVWAYGFRSVTQPCQPSPKGLSGRPAHRPFRGLLSVFEACLAFTLVAACTLALSPIRDTHSEGFSQFVTSLAAPVASGWSGRRVGLAPTGKRRLVTAHTHFGHSANRYAITSSVRLIVSCRHFVRSAARTRSAPEAAPGFGADWDSTNKMSSRAVPSLP